MKKDKKKIVSVFRPALLAVGRGNEKEKKKGRPGFDVDFFFGAVTQIVSAVLALVLVIYFGYHLFHIFTEDVSVVGVYPASQTETAEGTGYFIRDDRPVSGSFTGYSWPVLPEGSRVGKGDAVCRFYDSDKTPIRNEIESLDREIEILRAAIGAGVSSQGLRETYRDASSGCSELLRSVSLGDYASAAALGETLREKLGRLAFLEGGGASFPAELSRLLERRSSLLSSLGKPLKTVTAPESGYWFSQSDGREAAFGPSLVAVFSEDAFLAAKNAEPKEPSPAGVFCLSSKWYMAVEFEGSDSADLLTVGREYPLTAAGYCVIPMTLETKLKTGTGMLLLFGSDVFPSGFSWPRSCRVRVPVAEYSGYRVPLSAMRSLDGMTGVYTLNGGYVYFRRTEILTEGTGYYIVASYEDAESGPPATYSVLRRGERTVEDGYIFVMDAARKLGLTRDDSRLPPDPETEDAIPGLYEILTLHSRDRGIPVEYGKKNLYYYHLNDLESIIVSGDDL
ncbi:MAG: hypothetical protein ILO42_06970 [Clostridia bacterium]|nr:hypothetical protein [Clostridia bacterium]